MSALPTISIRNYAIVTAAYWAFTLTDGALRMLVLLHFNQLGYTPVQLAFLFLLYEFFGIVTNLVGGWLAARTGLRFTLVLGLALQVVALGLLALLNRELEHGAVGRLRDGLPGAVGDREGPDEDEREERRQGAGAEGRRVGAVQVGRGADRLEERLEGRRLLRRRVPAVGARLPRRARRRWRAACSSCSLFVLSASAGIDRSGEEEAGIHRHPVQFAGHQSPVAGAAGAVCRARRLVRRQRADLPGERARLVASRRSAGSWRCG